MFLIVFLLVVICNIFFSKIDNLNDIIKQNKDLITEQEKQINNLQQELCTEKNSVEMEKNRMETSQVSNVR